MSNMFPLPVSPNQVDRSAWVPQGLPLNPPFVPNIPLQGNIAQYLPQITGFAMYALQANAERNPLRTFTYNLYSRNRYNNEDFGTLIMTIAEAATFMIMAGNLPPEQAIPKAAEEVVSMLMAVQVFRHVALQNLVPSEQVKNEIVALKQQFDQLAESVRAFKNNAQRTGWGQQSTGWGSGNQGSWGGQQGGWSGQQSGWSSPGFSPSSVTGQQHRGQPLRTSLQQSTPSVWTTDPGQQHGGGGHGGPFKPSQPHLEEYVMDKGQPTQRQTTSREDFVSKAKQNAQRTVAASTAAPADDSRFKPLPGDTFEVIEDVPEYVPLQEGKEWPKLLNSDRPYDSVLLQEGYEMRPAKLSGWVVTRTTEKPFPLLYDPLTHLLFHIRDPEGNVTEKAIRMTPDMNYLDHELNATLREQVKSSESNQPKTDYDWALVSKLKPMPRHPISAIVESAPEDEVGEEHEDVDATDEPMCLDDILLVHTPSEADMRISLVTPEVEEAIKSRKPVEYYFDVLTPLQADKNYVNTVKALGRLQTMAEFRDAAATDRGQNKLSDAALQLINRRMTQSVNEVLKFNMGIKGWKISSFMADYDDLVEELQKDFGPVVAETLERHAPQIIQTNCSVLSGDAFSAYLKWVSGGEVKTHMGEHLTVFRERCSTTRVPWGMWQFDKIIDSDLGSMVPEGAMPTMYKAVREIFERTADQEIPFARHFLLTEDEVRYELRRGFFSDDCYLISKCSK